MNNTVKHLKRVEHYAAPTIEMIEIEIGHNILQNSGTATTSDGGIDMWSDDW